MFGRRTSTTPSQRSSINEGTASIATTPTTTSTNSPPADPATATAANGNEAPRRKSTDTAVAAENINTVATNPHPRSESIKPDGLSLPTFGIDAHDDDYEVDETPRLTAKDCMDPAKTAERLNRLSELVQELTVKSRDNNAILCQMLFSMEEKFNKKIDTLREEMVQLMDRKFQILATEVQAVQIQQQQHQVSLSLPPSARGRRQSSFGIDRNNSAVSVTSSVGGIATNGLGSLFESVESETASVSSKNSLAIPKPAGSAPSPPHMITEEKTITPIPGFVIKTRKLIGEKEKIFINVFHHELIEIVPHNLPKNITADQKPFLLFGSITHSLDSNGRNCSTYNIGVSSEYFKPDSNLEFKITAPSSIQKIIHKVNLKHNEFFDENSYSLPRLTNGFKGDDLPTLTVPVLVPVKKVPDTPPANAAPNSSFKVSSFPSATGPTPSKKPERSVSRDDDGDNDSVVSELTMRDSEQGLGAASRRGSTDKDKKGGGRRMTRKSIFDTSQLAINAGNIAGRNLLSGNMCEYIKDECIPGSEAEQLKDASTKDPYLLLGWQISLIMDNGETDIFVVTDVRKNYMSKTEYRLSRFYHDDIWVRLKRSDGKSGSEFRPLRKVLFGLQDDDDTIA